MIHRKTISGSVGIVHSRFAIFFSVSADRSESNSDTVSMILDSGSGSVDGRRGKRGHLVVAWRDCSAGIAKIPCVLLVESSG